MSGWDEYGTWEGEALRREAFFFGFRDAQLYGSIYAPPSSTRPTAGVLFCNSWGFEGNQASRIVHSVSHSFAVAGGVSVVFHYPGFGDSGGDFAEATIDLLAEATAEALREADRRCPGTRWTLAGPMLGASIAALAADRGADVERLLCIQPALRPASYFARLERASRRSLGQPPPVPGFAYGYRLTEAVLDSAAAADAAVEAALARFGGEGIVVRYAEPDEAEGAPERFRHVCAPGTWRFGTRDNPELIRATSRWLRKDSGMLRR